MKWSEFEVSAGELAQLGLSGFREQNPEVREHYGQTILAAIGWRPDEPYPLWSVDIESAAYISFGPNHRFLRWDPERGLEQGRHPDDGG